jgi:hypothetical protein
MLRDGIEVEYEAFLAEDVADGLEVEWKRDGSELEYEAFLAEDAEYEAFLAEDAADGLEWEWMRPMHWAGYLVVGAATRLPRHTSNQPAVV